MISYVLEVVKVANALGRRGTAAAPGRGLRADDGGALGGRVERGDDGGVGQVRRVAASEEEREEGEEEGGSREESE